MTTQDAWGHGSLPISEQILWRGDTMLVPTAYWGIFVGGVNGPWSWICDEAINSNQGRLTTLGTDGTLYASDTLGLVVSSDGGCSWAGVTDPTISPLLITGLQGDPSRPRVWAVGSSGDDTKSGVFFSDSAGSTWQLAYAASGTLPNGLHLSADGQTLLVSSVTTAMPQQAILHVSTDGGMTFNAQTLNAQIDGQALTLFSPLWEDSQTPGSYYISVVGATGNAVLRVDGTAAPVEVLSTPGVVYTMGRPFGGDTLAIGTSKGLYVAQGSASFTLLNTLSSAQCLSEHKGTLYACAWDFAPDQAAVAALSPDLSSFSKVFQFIDATGPMSCPTGTKVATICPSYWAAYSSQLGSLPVLASTVSAPPDNSSGCAMAPRSVPPGGRGALGVLLLILLRRRTAGRRRCLFQSL